MANIIAIIMLPCHDHICGIGCGCGYHHCDLREACIQILDMIPPVPTLPQLFLSRAHHLYDHIGKHSQPFKKERKKISIPSPFLSPAFSPSRVLPPFSSEPVILLFVKMVKMVRSVWLIMVIIELKDDKDARLIIKLERTFFRGRD